MKHKLQYETLSINQIKLKNVNINNIVTVLLFAY